MRELRKQELAIIGETVERQLEAFDHIGLVIGAAPVLRNGHLAKFHTGSERSQTTSLGSFKRRAYM
jgi:hypothetical protein